MKTRFKAAGRRPILSHTDIYKQLMNVSPVMKKMESSIKKKRGRPLGSKNKPKVFKEFSPPAVSVSTLFVIGLWILKLL